MITTTAGEFKDNLEKTKGTLEKKIPIFEAGFVIDNLYSRADILNPVGDEQDIRSTLLQVLGDAIIDINISSKKFYLTKIFINTKIYHLIRRR